MADADALDDLRYEHHLRHRGRYNHQLAQWFWIGICGIVAVIGVQRALGLWGRRRRSKHHARSSPSTLALQLDRLFALCRAVSLYTFRTTNLGRFLTLLAYGGAIVIALTCVDAPVFSTHFIDDVAFRAAWVTVTQVPLVYFLSTKRGPLNLLTGISYERINWLHRWIARSLFLCATAHMVIMMSSISLVDLMKSPDQAMAVVRYGAGAYGTLIWIVVSSILPVRRWSHRMFYINHWLCTLVFLGLVASHVPSYARLPIYASFAIVAMDKTLCAFKILSSNITVRSLDKKVPGLSNRHSRQVLAMGYPVKMMTPFITNSNVSPEESATIIRISNIPFSWKPGQHVRLYIPKLGALEMHPFTPATCSDVSQSPFPHSKVNDAEHHGLLAHDTATSTDDMLFMVKAHRGLTRRLANYHAEWLALPCPNASRPSSSLTACIDGPYGNPPAWEDFENIVLIASSTGVTLLLSILDYLEQLCYNGQPQLRTKQIQFVWANRHIEPQLEATVSDLLSRYTAMLRETGTKFEANIYTTCEEAEDNEFRQHDPFAHLRRPRRRYFAKKPLLRIRNPNAPLEEEDEWYEEREADLGQMLPLQSGMRRRSSCASYVSSTLVGDDSDSDSDSMAEDLDSSCWSRLPSLRQSRQQKNVEATRSCQCAYVRHEQKKLGRKANPGYVSRSYGQRPDVTSILSTCTPGTESGRTMVAVCSNLQVTMEIKNEVSRMNIEFARGRRKASVELHTEGFG